jgi:hypothetical protein
MIGVTARTLIGASAERIFSLEPLWTFPGVASAV